MSSTKQTLTLLMLFILMACENNSESNNESFSVVGIWNLIAFNGNPDEVYCPKNIEITTNEYIENEYGGSNCDQLYSFTNEYVLNNNIFTLIQTDVENVDYTILLLNQNELEWETTTPNANQVLKFTYERVN